MRGSVCVVLLLLCFLTFGGSPSDGARILAIFHMPAPSHHKLGAVLLKALAAKGHEVTMISAFPEKTPIKNYREIILHGIGEKMHGSVSKDGGSIFDFHKMWVLQQVLFTHMMGMNTAELALEDKSVQNLLNSDEKFDLVISEVFNNEVHVGLAHRFDCPFIMLSTIGSSIWTSGLVGSPLPMSYVPDLFLKYPSKMNYWQRLHNVYHSVIVELFRYLFYMPKQEALLRKYFKDAPPLKELIANNISMLLMNSHPILNDPKPTVPQMVEIGGFHVEKPKPLPKDLQDFMDQAKDGVVLFSMGSNLKSTQLPVEKRDAILKAFSKLKQKVLWKWEDDVLPGQPANVRLSRWLPQNDLMAHPNLKAFLTHGGLLSTTEAIVHGVPVIGIPVFGDQKMNVINAVTKGYGLGVPYDELTEEKLSWALNEIINNPKYKENIRKRSAVLKDQPVQPLDSAIFWVEHVLRHKGASHFRSAAMDLEWYELYLVDIFVTMFLKDVAIILIIYFIVKKCCAKKRAPQVKDPKKKKN